MDSEAEIKQREKQSNETPDVVDEPGDGDDGGTDLPIPSLTRKQWAAIGTVVVAIVAWQIYRSQQSASVDAGGSQESDDQEEADSRPDREREIKVEHDNSDPMKGDEMVAEAFRERGVIGDGD